MDTKLCNKCGLTLPLCSFKKKGISKSGKPRLQGLCSECNKIYQQKHYLTNKEVYAKKARAYDKAFKNWLIDIKSKIIRCPICMVKIDHYQLDFHHVDPSTKKFNISSYKRMAFSKSMVLEEIKKCILICSNCHKKLHYLKWTKQDLINMGYWCNGSIGCFQHSDLGS